MFVLENIIILCFQMNLFQKYAVDCKKESKVCYSFIQEPVINDINPRIGPQAGGTSLTISGKYMNAGTKREATVGNLECVVTR